MKKLILILSFFASISTNAMSKINLPYGMLISESDLIVHGKILKVNDSTYDFQVHNIIKGQTTEKIKVSIWKEWICDIRSLPLEPNVELMLFLISNDNEIYNVLNGSNGELFVNQNDSVVTYYKNKPITTDLMIQGIKLFSKHFKYISGECCDYQKLIFKQLTEKKELKKLIRGNIFLKAIVFEIYEHNMSLNN